MLPGTIGPSTEGEGMGAETGTGGAIGILVLLAIIAVIGIVVGLVARLLLPGPDRMSIGRTMLYGIGGSFLGGVINRLLGISNSFLGLAISVGMAMLLIWYFTRRQAGSR